MVERARGPLVFRLAAVALGTVLLASCSSDDEGGADATSPPPAQSTVLQPGKPGEPNRTLAPSEYPSEAPYNEVDVEFVIGMIAHHLQAIEMTELAKTRAENASVKGLAERIAAAQGPEIHAMASWLEARKLPVPEGASGHGGHGSHGGATAEHDEMYGMLTEEQMKEMAAADGAKFDELFLRGMIQHHQGAVAMSEKAQVEGSDLMANEMAADIASGQGAEIARMMTILDQVK